MQQAWEQLPQDAEAQRPSGCCDDAGVLEAAPARVVSSRRMVWATIAISLCCALAFAASAASPPAAVGARADGAAVIQLRKAAEVVPAKGSANATKQDDAKETKKAANHTKKHAKNDTKAVEVETVQNGKYLLVAEDFDAAQDSELSVKLGDVVQEMSKDVNGWKMVQKVGGKKTPESGYVPAWVVKNFTFSEGSNNTKGKGKGKEDDDKEKSGHTKKH